TALAFASCINAVTGMNMMASVILTGSLLFIFLVSGGMYSVAMTQTANFFVFMIMFAVILYGVAINPGLEGIIALTKTRPELVAPANVGLQKILAWFGTFWINVLLAQAAFQMTLSCKNSEEGQKGLYIAAGFNVIFISMGVLVGLAAVAVNPGMARGLVAVPTYLMHTLPAPLVGLFALGIWACALGWGAPCQFSGATSLGRDVGSALNPNATAADLVRYTKWSLAFLTLLMFFFAFLRSEQAAWWNIFAWTARNGATFAPVVAALFWPLVTKRAAVAALLVGFSTGLLWNHLGGWAINSFYLNTHPVWVGMSANILTIVVLSLSESKWTIDTQSMRRKNIAILGGAFAGLFSLTTLLQFNWLSSTGLLGMFLFLIVLGVWIMLMAITVSAEEGAIVGSPAYEVVGE
ncbi:sodium:solute symporter family protein, partial [Rhodopseudomonas palustris]|nr:sodium:solute symporter family protein [Rhodopseudomonas palustris]